jgi:hypothetical protein
LTISKVCRNILEALCVGVVDAARRVIEFHGIGPHQGTQVRGCAESREQRAEKKEERKIVVQEFSWEEVSDVPL